MGCDDTRDKISSTTIAPPTANTWNIDKLVAYVTEPGATTCQNSSPPSSRELTLAKNASSSSPLIIAARWGDPLVKAESEVTEP
eukprot:3709731-Pyramimonas_sp.AAC.1